MKTQEEFRLHRLEFAGEAQPDNLNSCAKCFYLVDHKKPIAQCRSWNKIECVFFSKKLELETMR